MNNWNPPPPTDDFSAAWCNANPAATSVMEAISFATPIMESFLIRTVADSLPGQHDEAMAARCKAFIVDEKNHTRVHHKLNAALLGHLGEAPPALPLLRALFGAARRHLSLPNRLLLVAALEHSTAVMSMGYLKREARWRFGSPFARELFALHAAEELAHCSAAFDLWVIEGAAGRIARTSAVLAIMAAGLVYASIAMPWILYRKSGRRLTATLTGMAGFAAAGWRDVDLGSTLGKLFSFARADYHPDRLIAAGMSGAAL
jgi:predicted metal-dependent hydrolase